MAGSTNIAHATPSRVERRGRGCGRDALDSMGSLFGPNDVDAAETEASCPQTGLRGGVEVPLLPVEFGPSPSPPQQHQLGAAPWAQPDHEAGRTRRRLRADGL